jgi:hypothetical protein
LHTSLLSLLLLLLLLQGPLDEHSAAHFISIAMLRLQHCHQLLLLLLLQGPLDERSAAYVVAMALLGLQHCHQLGIIYRGMSAITLLMTESGLVQMVDFRSANCCSGGRGYRMDRLCRAHIFTLSRTGNW